MKRCLSWVMLSPSMMTSVVGLYTYIMEEEDRASLSGKEKMVGMEIRILLPQSGFVQQLLDLTSDMSFLGIPGKYVRTDIFLRKIQDDISYMTCHTILALLDFHAFLICHTSVQIAILLIVLDIPTSACHRRSHDGHSPLADNDIKYIMTILLNSVQKKMEQEHAS
ncbi:MAG: hypothetical protein GY801_21260 [bacterium]|nr:hypothetical protein [bacterium]